jgi:biotin carboxyl carrier protein
MLYEIVVDSKKRRLELNRKGDAWVCLLDGHEILIDPVRVQDDVLSLLIDGRAYEIKRERAAAGQGLWVDGARYEVEVRDPRSWRSRSRAAGDDGGAKKLVASMPGKIIRVLVAEKEEVTAGQGIIVVEAMKMQNELKSPKQGTVQKLHVAEGSTVSAGDVLAVIA